MTVIKTKDLIFIRVGTVPYFHRKKCYHLGSILPVIRYLEKENLLKNVRPCIMFLSKIHTLGNTSIGYK